jgi:hypothetical protein
MARPSFKATKEQRKLVRSMAAIGCRHEDIAVVVGVRSPKTVRKHFRKELTAGHAEAVAAVAGIAYQMAVSGKYPVMTDRWLCLMDHIEDDQSETADWYSQRPSRCELVFLPPRSSSEGNSQGGEACRE